MDGTVDPRLRGVISAIADSLLNPLARRWAVISLFERPSGHEADNFEFDLRVS